MNSLEATPRFAGLRRDGFRPHALDGSLLWFHPKSGWNVRWDAPETRSLVRRAPRVVLFGITNRCNLACSFCSRDKASPGEWTAEEAFSMLSGLADRGVLEVAFGGGEPLAFAGFDDLVARLGEETPLAIHLTTNGTLLDRARIRRLAPHVGEIRVSVYDGTPWPQRLEELREEGVVFGVNVLATPEVVPRLPALFERLSRAGCRDVAVLRYVGGDLASHLTAADERALATAILNSPVRARLSVCFGDRLHPVPRLFEGAGGDCGAGLDFVTITSDRRLKACSFQSDGVPVRTAADVIDAWTRERARLLGSACKPGCARPADGARPDSALPGDALPEGVRVWRGFSGNNSGDCVLVGRFDEVEDARTCFDELVPGWQSLEPFSPEWKALLEREGLSVEAGEMMPESIARVGRSVMFHIDMTLEDDFPSLRALVWKRGGRVVYSGIHVHGPVEIVAGMRFRDAGSLEAANTRLAVEDISYFERRGLDLYGSVPLWGKNLPSPQSYSGIVDLRVQQLRAIANAHGAFLAAEISTVPENYAWPKALASRPPPPDKERLWARYATPEAAVAAARGLDDRAVSASEILFFEGSRVPRRYGVFAQRAGGTTEWLGGGPVRITGTLWQKKGPNPTLSPEEVAGALRPYLTPGDALTTDLQHGHPRAIVLTNEPMRVAPALADMARSRDLSVWLTASPPDRVASVVHRLAEDLTLAERESAQK
ncbi:MAG: radical SAM protein [Polyangiaceae bacterium]